MECDKVINIYRLSQDSLTRQQLDSRNSSERVLTFYENITVTFNDQNFKPFTTAYLILHPNFVILVLCKKGDYTMTTIKAKEIINNILFKSGRLITFPLIWLVMVILLHRHSQGLIFFHQHPLFHLK